MSSPGRDEPEALRAAMAERWEQAAGGWAKHADRVREMGMPVSEWLIKHVAPQPGQRLLELAAGPGDTGFLAAELLRPGGTLISSDAAEAMIEVARGRAAELGIDNVEFRRLELEWIDLPAASVDGILCRWGLMLALDPGAALQEARRVLRPLGRIAVAVWDLPALNPWATAPTRALVELGHSEPPDPEAPGMFSLAAPGRLGEMLAEAGFVDVLVEAVEISRLYPDLDAFLFEVSDLSMMFSEGVARLTEDEYAEVERSIGDQLEPFTSADGSLRIPGRSLVAAASA